MQVQLDLDDDQVESILVEGLKSNYLVHLNMHEGDEHHIHEAFQIMLAYFMKEKEYEKYMKSMSVHHNNYNAKRLAEAHNGL